MHEIARSIKEIILDKKGVDFPCHEVEYTIFANKEILPRVPNTVRGQHIFFLHPLQFPDPNIALMKMLLTNDALSRASVAGITLVTPYIPYLRQDRKSAPRQPISARMVADLIESNRKVEHLITIDMHADQEQGFFSIPVDNLTSMPLFAEYFKKHFDGDFSNVRVAAPDFGAVIRARRFAHKLGDVPILIVEKHRSALNVVETMSLIGDRNIAGTDVVMFDDMIDTGGTARNMVKALKGLGAREVYLSTTHGLFSSGAESTFKDAGIPVICTNSIPREKQYLEENPWLTVVPIENMLADAMFEASLIGGSVSKLNI